MEQGNRMGGAGDVRVGRVPRRRGLSVLRDLHLLRRREDSRAAVLHESQLRGAAAVGHRPATEPLLRGSEWHALCLLLPSCIGIGGAGEGEGHLFGAFLRPNSFLDVSRCRTTRATATRLYNNWDWSVTDEA